MDRCALFVDAGYVLADAAQSGHATRHREPVSWDYAGLLQLIAATSQDHTGLPVLRCYWYETAADDGGRTAEQDALAGLPGVKLRLGGDVRPGRPGGVAAGIHRDLATLAASRAISDAVIASAEEDLGRVIDEVQGLGVRVTIMQITADGRPTVCRTLRQECDEVIEVPAAQLRRFAGRIASADPADTIDQPAVRVAEQAAGGYQDRELSGYSAPVASSAQLASGQLVSAQPAVESTPAPGAPSYAGGAGGHALADPGLQLPSPGGQAPAGELPVRTPVPQQSYQPAEPPRGQPPAHAQPAAAGGGLSHASLPAYGHGVPPAGQGSYEPNGYGSNGYSASGLAPGIDVSQRPAGPGFGDLPPNGRPPGAVQPGAVPPGAAQPGAVQPGAVPPGALPQPRQQPPAGSGPSYQAPPLGAGQLPPDPYADASMAPRISGSLADAVQAARAEGFGFGEAVARDAPALWLEAVLARKPRMPSDLEARLLQGSALPIDSLLQDEVRHGLRRGFWDALERSRR